MLKSRALRALVYAFLDDKGLLLGLSLMQMTLDLFKQKRLSLSNIGAYLPTSLKKAVELVANDAVTYKTLTPVVCVTDPLLLLS
jgi:hypothetical protein